MSSSGAWAWWEQRERLLVGAVIALAVLVVVAAVALAASLSGGGSPTPSPTTLAAPPPAHHSHSSRTPTGHKGKPANSSTTSPAHSHTTSPTAGSSTTSTIPAVPGAAPVIAALSPTSGAAGQAIQVAGANFLSSDGQITATFNGQVAPTSCPAQNTCTITAPPITGLSSAQVVITTSSGTSNPVTFTYS